MRILSISNGYPPYQDSCREQLAAMVSAGLQQRGHVVQVLTAKPPRSPAQSKDGVHYALELDVDRSSRVPVSVQFFVQRKGRERRNVTRLHRVLADFNPDIALMWNMKWLQRRLPWIVEQMPGTRAIYYVAGTSPLQADEYSAYWEVFPKKHRKAPLYHFISRMALRQIQLENPGVLRMDFVMAASDSVRSELGAEGVLPLDSIVVNSDVALNFERTLDEVEAVLNQALAHRRLGPTLPPAHSRPLFDLGRWLNRPLKVTTRLHKRLSDDQHLALAAKWLAVAQDVTGDGGLAQLYDTGKRAWTPAYPETTGYAIPTLLYYAHLTRDEQLRERVQRMAEFLLSVQLANGAVPIVNNEMFKVVQPCAFDVGQVIYGYLAAYAEFNHRDYLEAARRAGDWLIRDQEPDGSWMRFTYHNVAHAWEVRVSWALLLLAQISSDPRYEQAAQKNIGWTRSKQHTDGWFDHLALVPGEAAVMHTIAYTLEGLLECGVHLNDADVIESARTTADVLLKYQRVDGSLPGAFADRWRSIEHFTCLTGNAQMAIVWQRLFQLSGDEKYLDASDRIINHACHSQLAHTHDRNLFGGVPGSDPIDGDYLPNSLPNWAAKFLMDALLLRQTIHRDGRSITPPR